MRGTADLRFRFLGIGVPDFIKHGFFSVEVCLDLVIITEVDAGARPVFSIVRRVSASKTLKGEVLPQPFGPMRKTRSPRLISKSTFRNKIFPPKDTRDALR